MIGGELAALALCVPQVAVVGDGAAAVVHRWREGDGRTDPLPGGGGADGGGWVQWWLFLPKLVTVQAAMIGPSVYGLALCWVVPPQPLDVGERASPWRWGGGTGGGCRGLTGLVQLTMPPAIGTRCSGDDVAVQVRWP